ncbi:MAG: hypothetical protein HZA53_14550 [Planctomycetes bacterium]|nr:hypothetical protein [Planctomycetota bacterium]
MIRPTLRSLALVVCAALVVAACNSIPTRKGNTVESAPNAKIEVVNPTDIAVLPVENGTTSKKVPVKELRAALEAGLVLRRYSPLATEFVDAKTVDAAFKPGSAREDAVLRVTIEGWDDASWTSHGAIVLKLSARILDSRDGSLLWSGKLDRRFDLGKDREHFTTEAPMRKLLCETVVGELMSALPARTAKPGRAE